MFAYRATNRPFDTDHRFGESNDSYCHFPRVPSESTTPIALLGAASETFMRLAVLLVGVVLGITMMSI